MGYIRSVDDDVLRKLEDFHGALVPGLVIGAYMVELAYDNLADAVLIDAVCESRKCIADSVQVMTSCTVGNGWLKVFDWGIFAITLYDKKTKKGVRAYLDVDKLPRETLTYKWFFREVGKDTHDDVVKELLDLKTSILSYENVEVFFEKKAKKEIKICEKCSYPFPSEKSDICERCSKNYAYYNLVT